MTRMIPDGQQAISSTMEDTIGVLDFEDGSPLIAADETIEAAFLSYAVLDLCSSTRKMGSNSLFFSTKSRDESTSPFHVLTVFLTQSI